MFFEIVEDMDKDLKNMYCNRGQLICKHVKLCDILLIVQLKQNISIRDYLPTKSTIIDIV